MIATSRYCLCYLLFLTERVQSEISCWKAVSAYGLTHALLLRTEFLIKSMCVGAPRLADMF